MTSGNADIVVIDGALAAAVTIAVGAVTRGGRRQVGPSSLTRIKFRARVGRHGGFGLGGGLDFRIPVIGWKITEGGSRSRQRTHTIDLTLVPEDLQNRCELRNNTVEEALVAGAHGRTRRG